MKTDKLSDIGQLFLNHLDSFSEDITNYRVSPDVAPNQALGNMDRTLPVRGVDLTNILKEYQEHILPGMNIWNHPGFMGYFNSSASEASMMAELLIAGTNANCMNWKSCPAGTELEELTIGWFRQMIGLPEIFWGIIYEGGSLSNFHALSAARESCLGAEFRKTGIVGKRIRAYITDQAHSSIQKALLILGFGEDNIVEVPVNERYEMIPEALNDCIQRDLINGYFPCCVVATIGSTSCTAVDPVDEIASVCQDVGVWLHVDAAHAGTAAVVDDLREKFNGWELADSIVINPHKWMFLSIDTSILYIKNQQLLKRAYTVQAEYLTFAEEDVVTNYNDYGLTLGRKFKALKLWMNFKYLGVEGLKSIIGNHLQLARIFERKIVEHLDFELLAPTNFSTVTFRYCPSNVSSQSDINALNERLLNDVNASGKTFITHTKLGEKYAIRVVISGYRTQQEQLDTLWETVIKCSKFQKELATAE